METVNELSWSISKEHAALIFGRKVREALVALRVDALIFLIALSLIAVYSGGMGVSVGTTLHMLTDLIFSLLPIAIVSAIIVLPLLFYTLAGVVFLLRNLRNMLLSRADRTYHLSENSVMLTHGKKIKSYSWNEFSSFTHEGMAFFLHKKTFPPHVFVLMYSTEDTDRAVRAFLERKLQDDKGKYFSRKLSRLAFRRSKEEFA